MKMPFMIILLFLQNYSKVCAAEDFNLFAKKILTTAKKSGVSSAIKKFYKIYKIKKVDFNYDSCLHFLLFDFLCEIKNNNMNIHIETPKNQENFNALELLPNLPNDIVEMILQKADINEDQQLTIYLSLKRMNPIKRSCVNKDSNKDFFKFFNLLTNNHIIPYNSRNKYKEMYFDWKRRVNYVNKSFLFQSLGFNITLSKESDELKDKIRTYLYNIFIANNNSYLSFGDSNRRHQLTDIEKLLKIE